MNMSQRLKFCMGAEDSWCYRYNYCRTSHLKDICLGTDEGNTAILAIHQHLPPEVLTQEIL